MDFYLVDEQEAELVVAIFGAMTPSEESEQWALDRILCNLIELGLVDADKGPACYQAWLGGADAAELRALYLSD